MNSTTKQKQEKNDVLNINDIQNNYYEADLKTYNYYFPELALERGLITKEAIRSKRRLRK